MFSVILITCPKDKAESIARSLLERRVAACVNIIPKISSLYWLEDKISQDKESLLVVKTKIDRFEDLKKHVKETHPYIAFQRSSRFPSLQVCANISTGWTRKQRHDL